MVPMWPDRKVSGINKSPDDIALVQDGRCVLTHGELASVAGRAAVQLADAGVRPGAMVPVLLRRSPEMVAVLLAITRLGAGYAALDTRWPADRVRRICSMLDPATEIGRASCRERV